MEEPTAVRTRSQDIFNANSGLQCFLYCSANKLGTRPFDSRSLKIDKKNIGATIVTKDCTAAIQ